MFAMLRSFSNCRPSTCCFGHYLYMLVRKGERTKHWHQQSEDNTTFWYEQHRRTSLIGRKGLCLSLRVCSDSFCDFSQSSNWYSAFALFSSFLRFVCLSLCTVNPCHLAQPSDIPSYISCFTVLACPCIAFCTLLLSRSAFIAEAV